MGFARLAVQHGYTIVPFAAVGAEETVDIVMDGDNPCSPPPNVGREGVGQHRGDADHPRHRTHALSAPGTPVLLVRRSDFDRECARPAGR